MVLVERSRSSLAVSPLIAELMLVAMAVGASVVVYAFVTGLIGGTSNGSGSNLVSVSGNILLPTGTTSGSLVLNIKNSAKNLTAGIVATFPTGAKSFTGPGAGGWRHGRGPNLRPLCARGRHLHLRGRHHNQQQSSPRWLRD